MKDSENIPNLLVVDDEKIITMHLEELLTNFGYNVVGIASNGNEAIEKAEKLQPDLILMDIIMPGEKSGIDAAFEIKNRFDRDPAFKIQDCYLRDVQTSFNSTASGMHDDGNFVEVDISLAFQEIVALDKKMVDREGY